MKPKIKLVLILTIILVVIIFIALYLSRKKANMTSSEAQHVSATSNLTNQNLVENTQPSGDVQLIIAEGILVSIEKDSLEIKNGEIKNTLNLIENPYIFQTINGQPVEKNLADLKEGTKMKIFIRKTDSLVVRIEAEN